MAVKELRARVRHKRDTSANWEAQDPVLLNGEIIIVDTADSKVRTKTGNGTKRYSILPFDDEAIYQAIEQSGGGSTAYNRTLTAAGWGSNNYQNIVIDGLGEDQNGVVGLSQDVSTAEFEAAVGAALRVSAQSAGAFTITYYGDKPTCDIPITIIVLG